jgi:adenosine/AMP kinase
MGIYQPWENGVELERHGLGKYQTVKSTEDAANSLLNRWPDIGDGPAFERAKAACLAALEDFDDQIKASQARQAFIDASNERRLTDVREERSP